MDISHITGQCRCGAVSYQFPIPPSIDLNSDGVSPYLKDRIMPPSQQKYPDRGARPNSNRWKGNHCHCAACRQTAGALMVDWVNIPTEYVKITRNGPVGKYRASDHATREFCQTCGAALFFIDDLDPDSIDITIATITVPNVFDYIEYKNHTWVEDASSLILDEAGRGGGLAPLLNDGLPKTKRNGSSGEY
ncbi:hypothetical protein CPB86DRAFT_823068 [Serendipita vermifera]|nr:hypothetical protein CPB86DRAFT_823068 [Serendipita vermifera]